MIAQARTFRLAVNTTCLAAPGTWCPNHGWRDWTFRPSRKPHVKKFRVAMQAVAS